MLPCLTCHCSGVMGATPFIRSFSLQPKAHFGFGFRICVVFFIFYYFKVSVMWCKLWLRCAAEITLLMLSVRAASNLGLVFKRWQFFLFFTYRFFKHAFLKKNLISSVSASCPHQNVHCQCLCGHILSGSNHIQLLVLWLLCLPKLSLRMLLSICLMMMKHSSNPPPLYMKTWHTGVFSPAFVICLSRSTAEETSKQNKANKKGF